MIEENKDLQGDLTHLAVAYIDFVKQRFEPFYFYQAKEQDCFDLASLTKPLTMYWVYYNNKKLHESRPELTWLIEHRAGMPAWGLLSKKTWRADLLRHPLCASETLYSDFSAIRYMLELQEEGINLAPESFTIWDKELGTLEQLGEQSFVDSGVALGKIHDPNARNLSSFCFHAGLFGTLKGISQTLLNLNDRTDFVAQLGQELVGHEPRFIKGWDRVCDVEKTLAGSGCSTRTFGHLGFTGTSIWIDAQKQCGHVILGNITRKFWYHRESYNQLRRKIGSALWENCRF